MTVHEPPKPPSFPDLPALDARYQAGGYLGSGATSHVWRGLDTVTGKPVVIKVMKKEEDPESFRLEYQVLHSWASIDADAEDDTPMIPRLLAGATETERPFLVLEFVDGEKVSDLLCRETRLEERLALTIGWQFCQVLHLLHTKLQRSYADMKLDNIWWDEKAGHIWVTDWNVVSEEGKLSAGADVERFAGLLYWIMTGITLEGRHGFTPRRLAQWGGESWQALSFGAQNVLGQALTRSEFEFQRYSTAESLGSELRKLAQAWELDWGRLLADGKDALDEGQPDMAMYWLSIARLKGASGSPLDDYEQKAEERLREITGQKQVQTWLEGQGIRQARDAVERVIESGKVPLTAQRWLQVVHIADALGPDEFREHEKILFAVMHHLEEDQAEHALGRLEHKLDPSLETLAPLQLLKLEARLRVLMEQGAQLETGGAIENAFEIYKQALGFLEQMLSIEGGQAYVAALRRDHSIPSPGAEVVRLEAVVARGKAADELYGKSLGGFQSNALGSAVRYLQRGLAYNADHQPLIELTIEWGLLYLKRGKYAEAKQIVQSALPYLPDQIELKRLNWLVNKCLSIELSCDDQKPEDALNKLEGFLADPWWGGNDSENEHRSVLDWSLARYLLLRLVGRVIDGLTRTSQPNAEGAWRLLNRAKELAQENSTLHADLDALWKKSEKQLEGAWREECEKVKREIDRIGASNTLASWKEVAQCFRAAIDLIPSYQPAKKTWDSTYQDFADRIARAQASLDHYETAVQKLDWDEANEAEIRWEQCKCSGVDSAGDTPGWFIERAIKALEVACGLSEIDDDMLLGHIETVEKRIRNTYASRDQRELLSQLAYLRSVLINRPLVRKWLMQAEACWQEASDLTEGPGHWFARQAFLQEAWSWIDMASQLPGDEPRLQVLREIVAKELDVEAWKELSQIVEVVKAQITRGSLGQALDLLEKANQLVFHKIVVHAEEKSAEIESIGQLKTQIDERRNERLQRTRKVKEELRRSQSVSDEAITLRDAANLLLEGVNDSQMFSLYIAKLKKRADRLAR